MSMMMNLRRRYGGKVLPYDAEVEYLESTGTQWIDSKYFPNTYSVIDARVRFLNSSQGYLFGSNYNNGNADSFYFQLFNNIVWAGAGKAYGSNLGNIRIYNDVVYDITFKGVGYNKVGNTIKQSSSGGVQSTYPMYILSRNNLSSMSAQQFRLYSFQIQENESITLDLIPVRVGQEGYMYDKVSRQLFGNSGTGNFIIGNDV